MDLKCSSDAKGPSVYRDHLPLLDERPNPNTIAVAWKVGDCVKIDLDVELVRSLQLGHGGWTCGMLEVIVDLTFFCCNKVMREKATPIKLLTVAFNHDGTNTGCPHLKNHPDVLHYKKSLRSFINFPT